MHVVPGFAQTCARSAVRRLPILAKVQHNIQPANARLLIADR
jgi:hypothetical protein